MLPNETELLAPEIVVEIGNSHEGSIGIAKSMIRMAKDAGARTVKFQMHIAEYEGTADEPFRVAFSDQDKTRQDYWRRVNFDLDGWKVISRYCESLGIEFLCTPFSVEAAKVLFENRLVKRWKIGSGQAVDWPLIDYVGNTGLPLIVSTGLINEEEISSLAYRLQRINAWENLTLLHCVSQYPAPLENLDIHLMNELRRHARHVGFSDHSGNLHTAMFAIAQGAQIVEVHMTPSRSFFGPDSSSSLLPEEIAQLISFANLCLLLKSSNGTKQEHFERVEELRRIFRKGLYWKNSLPRGATVTLDDLTALKPVAQIDVVEIDGIIGRKLGSSTKAGEPVLLQDFEGVSPEI